jgi:CRISPR/Cas system-associated exonuclease Cas4 (RecB family)
MEPMELPPLEVNRTDKSEPHFSFSQMNMYLRCSMQYYFRYIKGLIIPPNINLSSGKAIHEALEYNSLYKMKHDEDMPIEDLLDVGSQSHDKYMGQVEDANPKEVGQNKDENQSILTIYRRTQAPAIRPLAVEYPFRVELPDDESGPYTPVIGFIDSFSELPDPRPGPSGPRIIALEDYKRVSRKKNQAEVDLSPQLTLYDYVYNLQTSSVTDVVGFRQLGFTKKEGPYSTPLYRQQQSLPVRENRWKRMLNQLKNVQQAIAKGVFVPVDDPRICSWCGYKDICQNKPEE